MPSHEEKEADETNSFTNAESSLEVSKDKKSKFYKSPTKSQKQEKKTSERKLVAKSKSGMLGKEGNLLGLQGMQSDKLPMQILEDYEQEFKMKEHKHTKSML